MNSFYNYTLVNKIVEREYFYRFGHRVGRSLEIEGVRPSYFSIGAPPGDVPVLMAMVLFYEYNIEDISEECDILRNLGVPLSLDVIPMLTRLRRAKEWMPLWITKKSIQRLVLDTPFTTICELKALVRTHFAHSRKMEHALQNVAPHIIKFLPDTEIGKVNGAFRDIPTIACKYDIRRLEMEYKMKIHYNHVPRGPQYEWMIRILKRLNVFYDYIERQLNMCANVPEARLEYLLECLGADPDIPRKKHEYLLKRIRDVDPEYISDFEMCVHDFTIEEYAFLFQVKRALINCGGSLSSSDVAKLVLEALTHAIYAGIVGDRLAIAKRYLKGVIRHRGIKIRTIKSLYLENKRARVEEEMRL